MKKGRVVVALSLGLLLLGGGLVYYLFSQTTKAFAYSPESPYPVVKTTGCVAQMFPSVKGLYDEADLVAKVEVKEHQFQQKGITVHTLSHVTVSKLFKGDPKVHQMTISEFGGLVDTSKEAVIRFGYKETKIKGLIEDTLEGSPTMRKGNQYIVFLKKDPDQDFYTIVGNIQGKIKIDAKSNVGVATVDEERIMADEMFILQKYYTGKKIDELETEIEKTNKEEHDDPKKNKEDEKKKDKEDSKDQGNTLLMIEKPGLLHKPWLRFF